VARRPSLKKLPATLLVIGGGVIGLEFATVYTRMGAKVLVVEMLPQLLTGTDLEIAKTMARVLKKQGVEIALATKVVSLEKGGAGVTAVINGESTNGKDEGASSRRRSSRSGAAPSRTASTSPPPASRPTSAAFSPSTCSAAPRFRGSSRSATSPARRCSPTRR
jgi:phytoene dehydrogenase-like protein